jgi:single-strand DNA-binding protein
MAGSLNKVMIIGNVGRDPEMRYLQDGTPTTSFSVATNRRWNDRTTNEMREETEWFNVVAWRTLAETCNQFLTKGRKVYIEGRLQTRSWEGQDGVKHYRTEVIAQQMILLDRRPGTGGQPDDFAQRPPTEAEGPVDPDDLPF